MDQSKNIIERFMKLFDDIGDEQCDNGCHCKECDSCIEYDKLITILRAGKPTEPGTPGVFSRGMKASRAHK